MDFETIWYESFPYVYGFGGLVALFIQPGSALLKLSGVLLIVAALTTLRLRRNYRRVLFERAPTPASVANDALGED